MSRAILEKVDPDAAFEKYLDSHYGLDPSEIRKAKRDLEKHAEEPPNAPLGRVAFGPERYPPIYEPNTKEEKALLNALWHHFEGYEMLSAKNAEAIRGMMRKGRYPSVFVPPRVTTIYRGMTVKLTWLAKALGVSVRDLKRIGKTTRPGAYELITVGKSEVNFKFVPRKGAASWSKSHRVARGFLSSDYDTAQIILHADVAENDGRLMDASGLYDKVSGFGGFRAEKEVLGLGPIRVHMIEWEIEWE